ncbi:MAG: DUF819 family protein [Spirochaetes bacterium]|nr:DUF819 family protein [Spirochaetota bacterium]
MGIPLLIAFYILFPAAVISLCYRFPAFNKVGAVLICYIAGITAGNIGILPAGAEKYQMMISEAAVAIALPLLLFSIDVRRWSRLAGRTILSMFFAVIAIVLVATAGFFYLKRTNPEAWSIAGMAIGVYTGGTPNLAAIKAALNVDATTYIIVHTYDTVVSILYIVFCITIAQRVFLKFLPAFKKSVPDTEAPDAADGLEVEDIHSYAGILSFRKLLPLAAALALSLGIVAISGGVSSLFPQHYVTSVAILLITSLGIGASFIPRIRRIDKTFHLGMYVIYIFCLVVGSMANFDVVVDVRPDIMIFIAICVYGSMMVHFVFCRIFRIDTDTFIITSVSASCSPPFVPVVAGALRNREVILSGVTTGIIGYAIGNYLGISMAYLFRLLL